MVVIDERYTCLGLALVSLWSVLPIVWCSWMKDESDSIRCFCVFCIFVILVVLSRMCTLVLMSRTPFLKRGEYVTGFKFDQNIWDSSGFILFALAPPEVLFASVARCLNRHCARHAAPNRMQWHSWPRILIKWVPDWAIFHVWFIRIRYR